MWRTVKLSEIVNIDIGKTPSRNNPKYWDKNKKDSNVWVSIRDMSALKGLYIDDSREYISNEGAKLFKAVPKNILIMSFKLSIGKLAITKKDLRTNEAIAAFKIKDTTLITNDYLYYFLSSLNWDKIAGHDIKVKGKTLNKAKLKEILIILPSLTKQQSIVAKLDLAFTEIDRNVELCDTTLDETQKLKTTILTNALNVNDSKEVSLKDICTLQNGRAYNKKELLDNGKYKVLRVGNFFTSNRWYHSDLELDDKKYCDNGDLLYAWSASFGPKIWEGDKTIYHYHIWRVDINEKLINKEFLYYWFEFDKELIKSAHGTGTAMMHVSKGSMENRKLKLPTLHNQQLIAKKIGEVFNNLELVIKNKEKSKIAYTKLKSAIHKQELQV